jgi:hypothetical protein
MFCPTCLLNWLLRWVLGSLFVLSVGRVSEKLGISIGFLWGTKKNGDDFACAYVHVMDRYYSTIFFFFLPLVIFLAFDFYFVDGVMEVTY